ncbi:hypothetical protein GUITHDRAFT_148950 [Guillardia theta CCMP2712]|uniref:Uncharacterized protein n=1 Tax=Guillardia theta (strain CCMP2712) TaxID=905079 RepID=L1I7T0_GUITC|nr:hypothetical protein GUITHDRAFT_148950 [Guillardia theta CCMP2712]EKX31959.1 hypothetical protein GUITHDRAFT_148950 [Guillardia theta CCMP2712]|eukprot:XP_005818939.1 hypothetical protein GUITHDRAFT_148950 [Guillardia theta CCMP2712]
MIMMDDCLGMGSMCLSLTFDLQFSDIVHAQELYSTYTISNTWEPYFESKWPTTTISNNRWNDGNRGASWNYGDNFGGGNDYRTDHTIFGNYGVTDSVYSGSNPIKLCSGTHNAECSG